MHFGRHLHLAICLLPLVLGHDLFHFSADAISPTGEAFRT
jgi:hypothetical protein